MLGAVISIDAYAATSLKKGVWCLLEVAPPNSKPVPFGVLLAGDEFAQSLRTAGDLEEELSELEAEVLDALAADFDLKAREMGGEALLAFLEETLSHFLRISDRTEIAWSGSAQAEADRLFAKHVDSRVQPFVTHLPLYGLRAAATKFGESFSAENPESREEGWVRVSRRQRSPFSEDMFVAQVVGRSMEPLIPDGSLCVFRAISAGSRQGKRVLVEKLGETDFSARYTVKRYTSTKQTTDDGWRHDRIRLEPLNPVFEAFDLDGGEFESNFRVIAEFVEGLPL